MNTMTVIAGKSESVRMTLILSHHVMSSNF
jgi:hypothetical protein